MLIICNLFGKEKKVFLTLLLGDREGHGGVVLHQRDGLLLDDVVNDDAPTAAPKSGVIAY